MFGQKGNVLFMRGAPSLMMKKRMFYVLFPIILVVFSLILSNIGNIAIAKSELYQAEATKQQLRDVSINPKRGIIYDRNMNILAKSATVWTVFVSPNDINKKGQAECEKVAAPLSDILKIDKAIILQKLNKKNFYEVIAKKIEKPEADKIREVVKKLDLVGVHLVEDSKRYYPNGDFASSVIGFTGDENKGLYGIEAYYDKYLQGKKGRLVAAKNAKGSDMPFKYEKFYEPEDGNNIVLTLDEVIQHYLEKSLNDTIKLHKIANRAAGIVMDVNTGEILAMASKPDFDLNKPFEISNPDVLNAINSLPKEQQKAELSKAREAQWKNKAITEIYEPGSVFKVITGSAALEEKTSSLSDRFSCSGSIMLPGFSKPMSCWKAGGHGIVDFKQAMVVSCNPSFIQIGNALGVQRFSKYVKAYGITERSGIDLPGEESSLYIPESRMGVVELSSCAFGQSNKVTPIQMICAVSAAVNGGKLVKPHIVNKITDKDNNDIKKFSTTIKRQVISEETSAIMRDILEEVVAAKGGGNAYVKGYRIGGKSGTSQKGNQSENGYISSFLGFAPANAPKIAVLIICDNPQSGQSFGSVIAAPAIASVMADTLPYIGIEPAFTAQELATLEVALPNLVSLELQAAKMKLLNAGITPKVLGEGSTVIKQVPGVGAKVPRGGSVILYTQDGPEQSVSVPNLVGLSPAEANKILVNLGLNINITGGGANNANSKVQGQSVPVGQKVTKGTVINVSCVAASLEG